MLLEGAQATLFDIDHGTYPYVTSSNTIASGALTGSGIPPKRLNKVIGIAKAYTTRVGNGPFPTEELRSEGDRIREQGAEFGTTTGRPRRCGWFDVVAARYAVTLNGCDEVAIIRPIRDIDDTESFKKDINEISKLNCMPNIHMERVPDPSKTNSIPSLYGSFSGFHDNPLVLNSFVSAICTSKILSSSFIVPRGNSTDSSLTSVGMVSIPATPIIIAATTIGIKTPVLVGINLDDNNTLKN